jgi:hypothetical protein
MADFGEMTLIYTTKYHFKHSTFSMLVEDLVFSRISIDIIIPALVEVIDKRWVFQRGSLTSLTFESVSRFSPVEFRALYRLVFIDIVIPSSVEIIGEKCFIRCESLISLTFESRLRFS